MKTVFPRFIVIFISLAFTQLSGQVYNYAWMKGSSSGSVAVYGTMGVESPGNTPANTGGGITWTDQSANLWLYSGTNLWKYSPNTNNWTWVNGSGQSTLAPVYGTLGVQTSSNTPGSRGGSASWADASGNLWLFGGNVNNGSLYNDLWRYSITSNQWTWMGGSNTAGQTAVYGTMTVPSTTNIPGASTHFASWKDPVGNFWLYDGIIGNEVWRYTPSTGQWAWMSGTNAGTVTAVYGTLGVSSPSVHPGERLTEGVSDAAGNLYIFGGKDYTGPTFTTRVNDLWKYNISNNEWAWIAGPSTTNNNGAYGTQGVFTSTTVPPGRYGYAMWADKINNKIWVFGGEIAGLANYYQLNDTWCYNIVTGQWAWMKGDNTTTIPGSPLGNVYGIQTVPSASNTPGHRIMPTYWPEDPTSFWIFSGIEYYNSPNDLWRFNGCSASTVSITSTHTMLCGGSTATLTASGSAGSYSWNTGAQTNTISVSPSSTTVYYASSSGTANCYSATQFTLPVQYLSIALQNPTTSICSGHSYVLSASAGSSYSWSTGQTSQAITVTPTTSTIYSLSAGGNNCVMTATYALNVLPSPIVTIVATHYSVCAGQNVTLTAFGASAYNWNTGQTSQSIVATPFANSTYSVTGTATNNCASSTSYTIGVTAYPVLSVTSSTTISCSGSTVLLNASGATIYNWNTGQQGFSLSISPTITSTYTVTGITNGCSSTKMFTQQVKPVPTLTINSSANQVCSGKTVILSVSGASGYLWSTGQTVPSFSVSPSVTIVYTATGTSNGCSSTKTFTQQVLPLPALIVQSINDICKGETTTLAVTGANTYTWNVSGNSNTIQVNPITTTSYTVVGTAVNGCEDVATVTVNVSDCVGIGENNKEENDFAIYPNPTINAFNIKGAEGKTLRIVNALGQTVLEQKLESEITTVHAYLSSGVYYCLISGTEKVVRLVVQD
jgi:hypothetical protein